MKQALIQPGRMLFSVRGLLCVLAVAAMMAGCESRRQLRKTIKGKKILTYQMNTTGNTDQDGFIYTSTLVDALDDEADYVTVIDRFELTSLSVGIVPNSGNTAFGFQLSSLQASTQGFTKYEMVDLSKVPTTIPLNTAGTTLINDLLVFSGVDGLNNLIASELVGRNPGILSKTAPKAIQFRLKGVNIPASSRAAVTLTLELELTMEYTTCVSVPTPLFGSDTPTCDQ